MKHLTLMMCLFILIVGCKNNEKNKETEPLTEFEQDSIMEEHNLTPLEKDCYVYNDNGNLVKFEITEINGKNVKGNLSYSYAEKDKNVGTFDGALIGDKLYGMYTFMSEGIQSTRELAFKIEKDQIIEGYGDMKDNGTAFKDTTNINYNASTPLTKGVCN